jgi:hypothetical protein
MADWKQITARIRRARTSKDPAGQLSHLYEKTRDAMVAFELGKYFETSGQSAEAAKWYASAAERFRRADWKTKAQEAAIRLGGTVEERPLESSAQPPDDLILTPPPIAASDTELPFEQEVGALESEAPVGSDSLAAPAGFAASVSDAVDKKRRRRGRRGGRNRRKPGPAKDGSMVPPAVRTSEVPAPRRGLPTAVFALPAEPVQRQESLSHSVPSFAAESIGDPGGPSVKGRYGDPGLSSRISLLEMQFRRLLTCPPVKLNGAEQAPAGPGVFVLTDSDLTSYYYVEACQTLRIAVGNLLRGGTSRRGADSIKPQLAEHLGIPESRVAKYLADHCVVRWLQLDEGASHFAHFVIAVLRPTLNE